MTCVVGTEGHRQLRALVLEDNKGLANAYRKVLDSLGYYVVLTHTISDAREAIRPLAPDLMLVDIDLPDGNGLDLMDELRHDTRGRFIVISGDSSQRALIKSIRNRAVELLRKPVDLKQLKLHLSSGQESNGSIQDPRDAGMPCWIYQGNHHSLIALRTAMSMSAELSGGHSLITGDSGVDKMAVARELHFRGRRSGRLVVVDCQDTQDATSVVRFFGKEDPQTGDVLHEGYIEQAAAGTLVLDHVEDLSGEIQSRLLPLLDRGHFKRLDGMEGAQATVALVGIARDKTTTDVDESALQSDFLIRLSQNSLNVPTLRQCSQDLRRIADFLLQSCSVELPDSYQFSESSYDFIQSYAWPHNILELRSVTMAALEKTQPGKAVDIRAGFSKVHDTVDEPDINAWIGTTVAEMEKELLLATLAHFNGDKEQTARTLNISLKTLYNRINSY